jgi:hypothetical protein
MRQAESAAHRARAAVFTELQKFIENARFLRDIAERERKAVRAQLDAAKARLGIEVRDNRSSELLRRRQAEVEQLKQRYDSLTLDYEAAKDHRERLDEIVTQMTGDVAEIGERLAEMNVELERLDKRVTERQSSYFTFHGFVPLPGKKWLELPFLDAFNSPRKIENLWSDGLDQPLGSFGRIRRFDRCTTCHQNLDKTLPGTTTQLACRQQSTHEFLLPLPRELPGESDGAASVAAANDRTLNDLFGLQLAAEGLLNPHDVTIKFVRPNSVAHRARVPRRTDDRVLGTELRKQLLRTGGCDLEAAPARLGLEAGDVIVAVDGDPVPKDGDGRSWVVRRLLHAHGHRAGSTEGDEESDPRMHLTIRRGLPNPYSGHPQLDLFVSSTSPHRASDFACTVCHEGQGSATAFKWASHSPDNLETRRRWRDAHGWFDNPHWDFPMLPRRFAESTCLKCHHDVMELDRTPRFQDPSAPKLVRGYNLVRTLGCFGCHEIGGYGQEGRVGPDLRVEPNVHAAALQFKGAPNTGYDNLADEERSWIEQLVVEPENERARDLVHRMFADDIRKSESLDPSPQPGADQSGREETAPGPRFSGYVHRTLAPIFERDDTPGTMRKVGPSLRHVAAKLDDAFLSDWIRDPASLRGMSDMPRTFGLWDHLPGRMLRARQADLQAELARLNQGQRTQNAGRVQQIKAKLAELDRRLTGLDQMERRFEPIEIFSIVAYLRTRSQEFHYVGPPDGVSPVLSDEQKREQVERGRMVFEQQGCLACHDHAEFSDVSGYHDLDYIPHGPDLSHVAAKFSPERNKNGLEWLYDWIKQPSRYDVRTKMPDMFLDVTRERDKSGEVVAVSDPVADVVAFLMSCEFGDWAPTGQFTQLDSRQQQTLKELATVYLHNDYSEATSIRYVEQGIPEEQGGELRGPERELIITADENGVAEDDMVRKRLFYVARKTLSHRGCTACHDIPGLEDAKPIGIGLADWGRRPTSQLAFDHVLQYVDRANGTKGDPVQGAFDFRTNVPPFFVQHLKSESRIGFIFQKLSEPRSFEYQKS